MCPRAQLNRLQNNYSLSSLNVKRFAEKSKNLMISPDKWIERIACVSIVPDFIVHRQENSIPYLRVEVDKESVNDLIAVLKLFPTTCTTSSSYSKTSMTLWKVLGPVTPLSGFGSTSQFCFIERENKVILNVTPPFKPNKHEQDISSPALPATPKFFHILQDFEINPHFRFHVQNVERMMEWQGRVIIMGRRFERRKPPRIARCGSLFSLESQAVQPLGKLGNRVSIGEQQFMSAGFEQRNGFIERIYKMQPTREILRERYLREQDVLRLLQLEVRPQKEILKDALPETLSHWSIWSPNQWITVK